MIRRSCASRPAARLGTAGMTLNVNLNLALETAPDLPPGAALSSRFARRACRPIHPGRLARARSRRAPGAAGAAAERLRLSKPRQRTFTPANFPTQAAAHSDIIVMLGALEHVADVENLFTHLRFCKQDIVLSYSPTDLAAGRARRLRQRLSFYDLALLFDRYGFRIECSAPVDARPGADAADADRAAQAGRAPAASRSSPTATAAISAAGSAAR